MGRSARRFSHSGIYHVMFRGINHEHIFEEAADYRYMSRIIGGAKDEFGFAVYAYCYMSNHVHLVIREKEMGDISRFMKKMLVRYVMYFNRKYKRSGGLIANRYKSAAVETDEYFIPLVVYIHRNPVEAGIVQHVSEYEYSSYGDYVHANGNAITDVAFVRDMINPVAFIELHERKCNVNFDIQQSRKRSDAELFDIVKMHMGELDIFELIRLEKGKRNRILMKLREAGLSIREIERLTGISKGVIERCALCGKENNIC